MLTPEGEDIGLDGAAGRAVVVEAGDTAVDLERGYIEEAALERVDHRLAERLSVAGFLRGVHGRVL